MDSDSSTSRQRVYPRAPIIEAVVDLQFAEPIDLADCKRIQVKMQEQYPISNDWNEGELILNAATGATEYKPSIRGFRLSSLDQVDVAVVASKKLTVARLAPYRGWEQLRERAERDWRTYKSIARNRKITRIGVRYINRIDIPVMPGSRVELSDYCKVYIQVPQPPFPGIGNHMMQAHFPLDAGAVVVNAGVVPSPLVNHVSYALDIDIIREANIPQADRELWAYIDEVRDKKNILFEACITDNARALFE